MSSERAIAGEASPAWTANLSTVTSMSSISSATSTSASAPESPGDGARRGDEAGNGAGPGALRRLVLGSSVGASGAAAHDWGALPSDLDISSYDEVIVNLGDGGSDAEPVTLDGDPLPLIDQLARLLLAERGSLTVIGNPDTPIQTPDGPVPFSFLLPVRLEVESEEGRGCRVVEERLAPYFDDVASWSFLFTGRCQVAEDALEASGVHTSPGGELSVELTPLAESDSGRSIGVTARFGIPDASSAPTASRASRLTVLPAPTETDVERAIERLLALEPDEETREPAVFAATDETEEAVPDWVDDVPLPAEKAVREEMQSVEEEMARLEERLSEYRRQLRSEGHMKRLLYQVGDGLEAVVREALERLGATVASDGEGSGETCRLTDPEGRNAVVTVAGRPSMAGVEEVRDADRWVRDAIAMEQWEGRGLLIVNAHADVPPQQRRTAYTDEAVELAERFDVALLTTEQLFTAVRDAQRGTFDQDRFWETVMTAEGVAAAPGLER